MPSMVYQSIQMQNYKILFKLILNISEYIQNNKNKGNNYGGISVGAGTPIMLNYNRNRSPAR